MKNNKNIEISALKIFSTVAASQTLTRAAERLGITQSAVSQTIKQLEIQTDTQLVVTRTRPIKLTPSGQVLNAYAQQVIGDTQRMIADVTLGSKGGLIRLNVGMVDSFCDVAGSQFMQRLKPFTSKIALRTGLVSPLTKALLNRDLDILITGDSVNEHPHLERHPLLRDPFVILVPENFSQQGSVDLQWLASNLPFIQYNRQSRLGALTDLIARRMRITLQSDYELDSTQTLLRFVQSGHGWSIVTGLCIVRYPELLNNIRVMQLDNGNHARSLTLLCRPDELGKLPVLSADICRSLYRDEIVPQLLTIAPWLGKQAFTMTKMPAI